MDNEILQNIAEDIKGVNDKIEEARDLISAMKEAGEETGELETELRKLVIRKTKWENMLHARGL